MQLRSSFHLLVLVLVFFSLVVFVPQAHGEQSSLQIDDVSPGSPPASYPYASSWGRMLSLAGTFYENSPTTQAIYAASPNAGVWKSITNGAQWNQLTRPEAADGKFTKNGIAWATILDVAVAPGDPNIVFAGTAVDPRPRDKSRAGLYHSTDGGGHWHLDKQITCTVNGDEVVQPVTQVQFSPDEAATLYAAAGCALLRSVDSGVTWENLPLPLLSGERVWHFAVAPYIDPGRKMYACGDGVFWYSSDGGANWKKDSTLNAQLSSYCGATGYVGTNEFAAQILAIPSENPNGVYLAHNGGANGPSYFFNGVADGTLCNTNGGVQCGEGSLWYGNFSDAPSFVNWTKLPGPPVYYGAGTLSGAVYVKTVAKPSGHMVIFSDLDTVQIANGIPAAGGWHRLDGYDASRSNFENKQNVNFMHVDPHGILVAPNFWMTLLPSPRPAPYNQNTVYGGSCSGGSLWLSHDGGVNRTTDCAQSWTLASGGLTALAVVNLGGLVRSGAAPALYIGTGDNDEFYSFNGGTTWKGPANGRCGDCDVWFYDQAVSNSILAIYPRDLNGQGQLGIFAAQNGYPDPTVLINQNYYPYPARVQTDTISFAETLGYRATVQTLKNEQPLVGGDYLAIRQRADGTRVLLRARGTIASGQWTPVGKGLPVPASAGRAAVQAAGGHTNTQYFVGDGTGLWKSMGTGLNVTDWQQIVPGNGSHQANRFFVNPYVPGQIWIVDRDRIKKSADSGATWTIDFDLDSALNHGHEFTGTCQGTSDICVLNDLVFARTEPRTRFAIGLAGVFATVDGGTTWQRLLDTRAVPGLPRSGFFDALTNPNDRRLYVGLDGRGILNLHPIPTPPPAPTPTPLP